LQQRDPERMPNLQQRASAEEVSGLPSLAHNLLCHAFEAPENIVNYDKNTALYH
jgi:hypothetical protein